MDDSEVVRRLKIIASQTGDPRIAAVLMTVAGAILSDELDCLSAAMFALNRDLLAKTQTKITARKEAGRRDTN